MRRWLPVIALLVTILLCGCNGSLDSMSGFLKAGFWHNDSHAGDIVSRARELEANAELAMALNHWRLVQRIAADPAQASREVARLERKIASAAAFHYQSGLVELKKNSMPAARNHFLAALRLNPDFQPALQQIRANFSRFPLVAYQSVPGDQPSSVAQKVFGDEKKAYLVTWFNDLPQEGELSPGSLLLLPKLEKVPSKKAPKKKPSQQLAAAKIRLAENDIDGALTLAEQADTANADVQALIHTIHLKKATARIQSGLLDDARQSIEMVPDGFPGKHETLEHLSLSIKNQQTMVVISDARKHLDQGHYQHSLGLVDKLLETQPDSAEARNLADEARYRLALAHADHKRYLEAMEVLATATPDHQPSMALRKTVHSRLTELAQIHYRNGVKHFINEDLQSAIEAWEKALACNPDHAKARENIDNARRLMQKIETLP